MTRLREGIRDPATGVVRGTGRQLGGFRTFILRGNVVDLAVGIVIGAAFTSVVQALVRDFITPLISLFGGAPDFATYVWTVRDARFGVGGFVNALLSFLLIALLVYFLVVLPVNALMERYKPEPVPAPTKECPECTSRILQAARRCPQCAAQLAPPQRKSPRRCAWRLHRPGPTSPMRRHGHLLTGSRGGVAPTAHHRSAARPVHKPPVDRRAIVRPLLSAA